MGNDIIFESTYANVKSFVIKHRKNVIGLTKLCSYIRGEGLSRPPSLLEREFITDFFGDVEWATYISRTKNKKPNAIFNYVPKFDLELIYGILSFKVMDLATKELTKLATSNRLLKTNRKILKAELKSAVNNSYEDGVFYKVDGWCNVADVLVSHKLLKLEED